MIVMRWCLGGALVLVLWFSLTMAHAAAPLLVQLPADTAPPTARPPIILTPAPPAAQAPAAGPAEGTELMASLLRFVLESYLGNGRPGHVNPADIYADVVGYYGRGRVTRAQVLADKQTYYRRWPERTYTYIPDSLRIERGAGDTVTITFRHRYEVAAGQNRRAGIATTRLDVSLQDGRFVIVGEGGMVERRG
jgi:hypothetical protein